jgi:multidrug efflux system membrane fusion protein
MTTNTTPTDLKDYPEVHRSVVPEPPLPKPPAEKSKKRGIIWALFLVIIAAVTGYAVWRAGQPQAFTQPNQQGKGKGKGRNGGGGLGPVPVVTAKVKKADVPVYLDGLGNVVAFYTVTVKSRVDGQLMKVNFNEGDLVQKDQVLMEIDPRPYQVQLDLAEGTLAHDQALLENARLDLERYKTLLAQDAVPKQQLDTQVALVAQYVGNIKQDQANIDSAKLNLVYAKVTAPITGTVGLRLVDPGNIVHASDANGMIVITQLQPIQVQFTIPEDSLPQVMKKLRAGAHLGVDAYNRDNSLKLATGQFQTVDNQIDNTTGTSRGKAVFDNKDNTLFPQQFVNIRLKVDVVQNALVVPQVAIQNGQQGTFVYTVDPETSKVHIKVVKVGITDQDIAQVLSGVGENEQVVIDGTDRLDEGTAVRVRAPGELDAINAPSGRGRGRKGRGGNGGNGNNGGARNPGNAGAAAPSNVTQQNGPANPGGFKNPGEFRKGDGSRKGEFKKRGGAPNQ